MPESKHSTRFWLLEVFLFFFPKTYLQIANLLCLNSFFFFFSQIQDLDFFSFFLREESPFSRTSQPRPLLLPGCWIFWSGQKPKAGTFSPLPKATPFWSPLHNSPPQHTHWKSPAVFHQLWMLFLKGKLELVWTIGSPRGLYIYIDSLPHPYPLPPLCTGLIPVFSEFEGGISLSQGRVRVLFSFWVHTCQGNALL